MTSFHICRHRPFVKSLDAAFKRLDEAVGQKQNYETKQIKSLFHGEEGRAEMKATVALTEKARTPLIAAIRKAQVAQEIAYLQRRPHSSSQGFGYGILVGLISSAGPLRWRIAPARGPTILYRPHEAHPHWRLGRLDADGLGPGRGSEGCRRRSVVDPHRIAGRSG